MGVNSKPQNPRERDFESGHPWWVYALIGIGIAGFFVSGLVFLVNFILK